MYVGLANKRESLSTGAVLWVDLNAIQGKQMGKQGLEIEQQLAICTSVSCSFDDDDMLGLDVSRLPLPL